MGAHASRDEVGAAQQQIDKFGGAQSLPQTFPEIFRYVSCTLPRDDEAELEILSCAGPCLKHISDSGKPAQFRKPSNKMPRSRVGPPGTTAQTMQKDSGQQRAGVRASPSQAPMGDSCDKARCPKGVVATYKVGDLIEIWSTSQHSWRQGSVEKVKGDLLHIVYPGHEGQLMRKILPKAHEELRLPQDRDSLRPHADRPSAQRSDPPPSAPAAPPPPQQAPPAFAPNITGLESSEQTTVPQPIPQLYQSLKIAPGALGQSVSHPTPCGQLSACALQTSAPQIIQPISAAQAPVLASLQPTVAVAAPCAALGDQRQRYVPADIPNAVPLAPGVERLEPEVVQSLLQNGACVLVDVRGEDRAVGLIPGAIHIQAIDSTPFYEKIPSMLQRFKNNTLVVFTCQYSAHRAPQCANWYREQADSRQRVAILSGGFRAWEGNRLPVESGGGDSVAADAYALEQGAQVVRMGGATPPKSAAALYAQLRR